ncbi:NAD-dependent epimerase/dehydratase family protein [Rhabdothermincola salaria]|uniref:NAD-dependent epimerase/dehydratase family protein n=1 Tax=Rhabdothermincola salaria TaxID=2903142 RepID=UPI001E5144D8|nr:NAD-dependent epimerase/dehydratase family protein [Rhabdothermincola salaria]MCD9625599.1 NAD-dependent epimerase/dehydratase family protein [Rhabdothermincola salaria]
MGNVVVVTGAAGSIGRRVVDDVASDRLVRRVVAVDRAGMASSTPGSTHRAEVRSVPFALDDPRLAGAVAGATEVILVSAASGPELDGTGGAEVDLDGVSALLGVLGDVDTLEHMVVVSSGLVYGSSPDNPLPLTERVRARPDPEVPAAVAKAELEHRVRRWAVQHQVPCTVLRPSVVVAPENARWLGRSPWSSAGLQVAGAEPPVQFLHVDDLVTAVAAVRRSRPDAVVNVAPDGWITADERRALKGPAARVRLPRAVAVGVARLGRGLRVDWGDPSAVIASAAPWVLANDRLKATGWRPTHTSEEAFVVVDPGGPWSRLTPRDRQTLALGSLGVAVATALGVVLAVVQRLRRAGRR